jgi:hypothetical protein
MTDGELKIYSDTAWNIASQWSWTLASDTRTLAAQIDVALSETHATGRREGLSEAAKWHDDECHRLHQQIKENLRYMSTHGLRGSDANDSCREQIITHKLSAAAIRAAMEKEE